jgi:cation transport regulator ChaC
MAGCWVFGYGSLVSPVSFGFTVGRELAMGVDVFEADIGGYGRRWNYGIMHTHGIVAGSDGDDREMTIVALGVVASPGETTNGVIGWVDDVELVELDRRERHYDRVDVTRQVDAGAVDLSGVRVMTYVPRAEAIDHYERARDRGRAAIEQRYWDLVDGAFTALGPDQRRRYLDSTPEPDVPVLTMERVPEQLRPVID